MDFWQTRGGLEFQHKLLRQLTRIADGIEAQNGLYERLLPADDNERQLASTDDDELGYECIANNCDHCEKDRCQPFIAKPIWFHDDDGNDVLHNVKCSCTCHVKKEITV